MSDGIEKSLLDRLQALRGTGSTHQTPPSSDPIKFDVIERARTPTGGDILAARLKSLREQVSASPPRSPRNTPAKTEAAGSLTEPSSRGESIVKPSTPGAGTLDEQHDEDDLLATSDQVLEEMLAADMDPGWQPPKQQSQDDEAEIRSLLEQLSASVPTDAHSDDSDSETMTRESEDLIAQHREDEEDGALPPSEPSTPHTPVEFPSAPGTESTTSSTEIADLTARMAALRYPSDPRDALPSVPTSRPSKPVKRLVSQTGYTDDDMDSWCTVCLEDATLRCLGCEGDVYCSRCWREMHVGPAAHFDDTNHKAVQFTSDRGKTEGKIALGA